MTSTHQHGTAELAHTPIVFEGRPDEEHYLDASGYEHTYEVRAHLDEDGRHVHIDVNMHENFNFMLEYIGATKQQLDEGFDKVHDLFQERFGAELFYGDDIECVDVSLRRTLDRDGLTEESAHDAAWGAYAKFMNETDPGTYGSPYIGDDVKLLLGVR